jgi:hypothetical protein
MMMHGTMNVKTCVVFDGINAVYVGDVPSTGVG